AEPGFHLGVYLSNLLVFASCHMSRSQVVLEGLPLLAERVQMPAGFVTRRSGRRYFSFHVPPPVISCVLCGRRTGPASNGPAGSSFGQNCRVMRARASDHAAYA